MENHRYKLGKAEKPKNSDAEINTARNVLIHYNNVQRSLNSEPTPHHTRVSE